MVDTGVHTPLSLGTYVTDCSSAQSLATPAQILKKYLTIRDHIYLKSIFTFTKNTTALEIIQILSSNCNCLSIEASHMSMLNLMVGWPTAPLCAVMV